jgi:cell division protein FtsB
VIGLFAIGAVLVAMLLGPLQSFNAASQRVEELEERKARLTATVTTLERRRAELDDPDHIELLAREELGLVRPGEIPYVVTGVEPDVDQLRDPVATAAVRPDSWWRRIARAFSQLFQRTDA